MTIETTLDGLLNKRLLVEQPSEGFRIAVDTVLLAAAVPARAGQHVLDFGCGVGGAMLALACRVPGIKVTGVEIQDELVRLCEGNIERNNLARKSKTGVIPDNFLFGCYDSRKKIDPGPSLLSKIKKINWIPHLRARLWPRASCGMTPALPGQFSELRVIQDDVTQLPEAMSGAFDHVMMNPPYHDVARHDASLDEGKRIANTEEEGNLPLWIGSAAQALKDGGTLTLIHRADRLDEILDLLKTGFGAVSVKPIRPKTDTAPKRVILRAEKSGPLSRTTCQPLVLHNDDGSYTAETEAILRDVSSLEFNN